LGDCVSPPSQGLFPAKSLRREGGKEAVCEIHFCCTTIQAQEPWEGRQLLTLAALLQKNGLPCLGHEAGLDQVLSVSCCCPVCLLLHLITECSSWVKLPPGGSATAMSSWGCEWLSQLAGVAARCAPARMPVCDYMSKHISGLPGGTYSRSPWFAPAL